MKVTTLIVDTNFDNGRVQVDSIDQNARSINLSIPPDNHTQDVDMRCWHCRISGIVPGERVTIKCVHSVPLLNYCYSYDGDEWFRFPAPGMHCTEFRFEQSSVFVACNIVYPYCKSIELAENLGLLTCVQVSNLTISEEGRQVKLLRITDPGIDDCNKKVVWMQARAHAFEPGGSWVAHGCAQWMVSEDASAQLFRNQTIAYIVPILDVDNVYKGMSGKNQPPVDFYYGWNRPEFQWNAVAAVKKQLAQLHSAHSLLAFFDIHSPRLATMDKWSETYWEVFVTQQDNWHRFTDCFVSSLDEIHAYNSCSSRANVLLHGTMSSELSASYVAAHWGTAPDYVGGFFEVSHFLDMSKERFMTKQGYLQWGEALGRALQKYVHLSGQHRV